ncbi:hypothetical protein HYS84_03035 [Candidatus Saccharibacteria bacterium]|nr:hypothetical protein [Candidatus Saccharibacteria bacterium]
MTREVKLGGIYRPVAADSWTSELGWEANSLGNSLTLLPEEDWRVYLLTGREIARVAFADVQHGVSARKALVEDMPQSFFETISVAASGLVNILEKSRLVVLGLRKDDFLIQEREHAKRSLQRQRQKLRAMPTQGFRFGIGVGTVSNVKEGRQSLRKLVDYFPEEVELRPGEVKLRTIRPQRVRD